MNLADRGFTGSIPQLYEHYLVPLIFEPFALDLAARAAALRPSALLEIAAGTGVLTRHLAAELPAQTTIVASDLNPAMLDMAATLATSRAVQWRLADAQLLPFADASFDLVACQFGVMFFPDRPAAFAEIRRVLRPGGVFLFNVWDHLDSNELAATVTQALAEAFPDDPPRFLARTPHGCHDVDLLRAELEEGGFEHPADIITLPLRARAESPSQPALGFCQGTPLRAEIEARAPGRLPELTAHVAKAIGARFGVGALDTLIQAHIAIVGR
ncbi:MULTISPECIES: class I SAM-dependent methyltransferase [unclassified Roseateles]|uniref:class I SAM-dependent methyltransferase n=1 Tax=unclassified Roseateles TaxID=2626991 RepID=UPI0006F51028|nr:MULTISPECIES: class I SAM-dependent methyltransferase [unclassified Roseateles]KQW52104.1 SAM-dependent methyltransferase [Pelomonas sp. Root405]KRA78338.1 SAM-dependent methyltransferase [Pelomonas sp. Root662]